MKQLYKKTLYIGMCSFLLNTSCDVMDTKPFQNFSEDLVWGSFQTADAFVVATYDPTIGKLAGHAWWETLTPNGTQCDQVNPGVNTVATEVGIDAYYGKDNFGRFDAQRRCNLILEKVAESTVLTESQKKHLTAEGHFLRGVLYFDMTRRMGRFVPITKVLDIDSKEDFNTPLTASVAESYEYVMADLDVACSDLPETAVSGRATKYAALLIRSRVALQAYAYTKDEKYLDIAVNSAQEVIQEGGYTLTTNYGSIFNNESPTDGEIIMARYFLDDHSDVGSFSEMIHASPNLPQDEAQKGSKDGVMTLRPDMKTFDGWGQYWPTQDLVDQYLMIDEATGEAVEWYEASQITENMEFIDPASMSEGKLEVFKRFDGEIRNVPTSQDMQTDRTEYPLFTHHLKLKSTATKNFTELFYQNRDKRLEATVVRDMTEWQGENIEINTGGNASQGIRIKPDGGWYTTTTGYYWRKNFVDTDPRVFYATKINIHFVLARLGEAYMNLAEAQLLKGNVSAAVEALNMTRTNHGGLPGSTASTLEDAWKDYIRERRVEMAYENGDIFFSYLRWGQYGGHSNEGAPAGDDIRALNKPVYKIQISSDRQQACIGQLTLLTSENRKFTRKRYLFPIPKEKIDQRSAHGIIDEQNPGW